MGGDDDVMKKVSPIIQCSMDWHCAWLPHFQTGKSPKLLKLSHPLCLLLWLHLTPLHNFSALPLRRMRQALWRQEDCIFAWSWGHSSLLWVTGHTRWWHLSIRGGHEGSRVDGSSETGGGDPRLQRDEGIFEGVLENVRWRGKSRDAGGHSRILQETPEEAPETRNSKILPLKTLPNFRRLNFKLKWKCSRAQSEKRSEVYLERDWFIFDQFERK